MKEKFFKKKKTVLGFSLAGLIGGAFFLEPNLTGNVISNGSSSLEATSLIGLGLIFCSIVLASYSLKK